MAKTRNSIAKRFRITKNGKILRRLTGQDHNLAKRSSKKSREMRKWVQLSPSETRVIRKILTY